MDSLISFFQQFSVSQLGLNQLSQFHFLRPWWLMSLIPLFYFYRTVSASDDVIKQWQGHMSDNIIKHLSLNQQYSRRFNPKSLFAIFAIIATLVMAGPSWTKKASPFFVDESALIIALDVSESMQNTDVQPSRLLRAKQKIVELLTLRGDAKTALIVYSNTAHVAMPITQDKAMILYFLDVLDTKLLPEGQAKPESMIAPALTLLEQTKSPSTLLVLTDQTNQQTISELTIQFKEKPHRTLIWAIGENPDSGLASSNGLTEQQRQDLSSLANAGNGEMVLFTHNSDDVEQVNSAIENNMFAANDTAQPWYDHGYLLLLLLLPIQALWFRRGWTMQW